MKWTGTISSKISSKLGTKPLYRVRVERLLGEHGLPIDSAASGAVIAEELAGQEGIRQTCKPASRAIR